MHNTARLAVTVLSRLVVLANLIMNASCPKSTCLENRAHVDKKVTTRKTFVKHNHKNVMLYENRFT